MTGERRGWPIMVRGGLGGPRVKLKGYDLLPPSAAKTEGMRR